METLHQGTQVSKRPSQGEERLKEEIRKPLCTYIDAFVDLIAATLVEEAMPKEKWDRIIAGFNDLEVALDLKKKLKCSIKETEEI